MLFLSYFKGVFVIRLKEDIFVWFGIKERGVFELRRLDRLFEVLIISFIGVFGD